MVIEWIDILAKRKKTFPCGHKGMGQFCHTCHNEKKVQISKEKERQEKYAWNALFSKDVVDLSKLPNRKLVLKARDILEKIASGWPYQQLKGKQLNHDRQILSIPVNQDYRLLFKRRQQHWLPIKLLSHEEYNTKKPGAIK